MPEILLAEQEVLFLDAYGDGAVLRGVVVHLVVLEDLAAGGRGHLQRFIEFVHHLRIGGESHLPRDFGDGIARVPQQAQALGNAHFVHRLNDGLSRIFFELRRNIRFVVAYRFGDVVEGDFLV